MSITNKLLNPFKPGAAIDSGNSEDDDQRRKYADIMITNRALLPLLALGLIAAFFVGVRANATAEVLLWCMACLSVGGTIGFLFGIPRYGGNAPVAPAAPDPEVPATAPVATERGKESNESRRSRNTARPNTNLEEVSDWLTKILVGLSLVHFQEIEKHVVAISRRAAASLRADPTAAEISIATALIIGFTAFGFLCSYLYTRLFLQGAFDRSNGSSGEVVLWLKQVDKALSLPAQDISADTSKPSIPSVAERQVAERVMQVAPTNKPEAVLAPLRTLAQDYERVRNEMPPSAARTQKMGEIATGMKRLGLATAPFLPELTRSASPGERLAAVLILQMKFDPTYIDWLAKCLVEEPAFCGFQAASALLARVHAVGDVEKAKIKAAVEAAKAKRDAMGLRADAGRDGLMKQILES